jgi:hypothetical protein
MVNALYWQAAQQLLAVLEKVRVAPALDVVQLGGDLVDLWDSGKGRLGR